jgi:type II secretory pathway component PulJ
MSKRPAVSLVELLVVLSFSTVILTTSAGLIHKAMRAQEATRNFVDSERTALRLAAQFRSDVHAASAAEVTKLKDDGRLLKLTMEAGGSVEYRRDNASVVRVDMEAGRPTWRDEFVFAAPLAVSIHSQDSPRSLTLSLQAGAPPSNSASDAKRPPRAYMVPTKLEIMASLNRDRRLSKASTSGEVTK